VTRVLFRYHDLLSVGEMADRARFIPTVQPQRAVPPRLHDCEAASG
jgi:hypothetical protein